MVKFDSNILKIANFPNVKAHKELKNGYVVGKDNTNVTTEFVDAEAAQTGDLYIVNNIYDKPETKNTSDYNIGAGEFARLWRIGDCIGQTIELSGDVITGASIAVGDILVPSTKADEDIDVGVWKKVAASTGYKLYLEVTQLNSFGNSIVSDSTGVEAVVKAG